VQAAAAEHDEAPVIAIDSEGVLVVGGKQKVAKIVHRDRSPILGLPVHCPIRDEVFELVRVVVQAFDLVDLKKSLVQKSVGEPAEQVALWIADLARMIGAQHPFPKPIEYDPLSASLPEAASQTGTQQPETFARDTAQYLPSSPRAIPRGRP
jgi:hypothetical protein